MVYVTGDDQCYHHYGVDLVWYEISNAYLETVEKYNSERFCGITESFGYWVIVISDY